MRTRLEAYHNQTAPLVDYYRLQGALKTAVVGDPEGVRRGLEAFVATHRPDEIMITAQIYDHAARLHSYHVLSEIFPIR